MPATWRWRTLLAGIAVATVMILGPPEAHAALTTVQTATAAGEPSLYNGVVAGNGTTNFGGPAANGIMESLGYGAYGTGFERVDDSSDELWEYIEQLATIRLQVKYAGDASNFGAFPNPADTSAFLNLASVSGSGETATMTVITPTLPDIPHAQQLNSKTIAIYNSNPPGGIGTIPELFAWGINDTSTGTIFSSLSSRNGGSDHMVAFKILPQSPGDTLRYVIAFEDRAGAFPGSDRDFNDLVLELDGVNPTTGVVPEPSTLAMAGIGLACFAGRSWRRRRQARRSAV